jgi:hypothetical protein
LYFRLVPPIHDPVDTYDGSPENTVTTRSTPPPAAAKSRSRSIMQALDEAATGRSGVDAALARAQQEVAGLEKALESRTTIGTAVGLVMSSRGISSEEAFRFLVEKSMHSNVKLRDIAAEIVTSVSGQPPADEPRFS